MESMAMRETSKFILWAEFLGLTVVVPLLIYAFLPAKYVLLMIWVAAAYCYAIGRWKLGQGLRSVWRAEAVTWPVLKAMLQRFAVSAVAMAGLTYALVPELLFAFVREKPALWLLVMLAYPILSVIPQEIIFRSFFFARYRPLLAAPLAMVAASALAFGFAHILFHNWVAPILCVIGGVFFARTYQQHRSLALVSLEHALYGDFLFTIGLGRYFYHGTVAAAL